jgi:hypothetical protein
VKTIERTGPKNYEITASISGISPPVRKQMEDGCVAPILPTRWESSVVLRVTCLEDHRIIDKCLM